MKLKWGDILIFVLIASAIAVMFFLSASKNNGEELTAQVIQNGEIIYEINLGQTESVKQYLLDDGDVVIEADPARIRFLESDCLNQICVHTGWISRVNQIAACLPNKILIKLVGNSSEVDVVVQ